MELNIVTGGDSKYFDLINELCISIEKLEDKNLKISVLDGGLSGSQVNYFRSKKIDVIDPGWPDDQTKIRAGKKKFLKVELAKANLDKLLPNAEYLFWVDADAWFQNGKALDIVRTVIKKNKLAIVSQASRLQGHHMTVKKIFGPLYLLKNILYKNANKAKLATKVVNELICRPTLNAGIFAIANNAPHWNRLRYWQSILVKNRNIRLFTTTQLALGIISYYEKLGFEAMPETCNYMGPYRWSANLNLFIDYYAPYDPVSIMHMAAQDKMRDDKTHKIKIIDENDNFIEKSLRYFENIN
jgi:hypothetical protein|tara:strand:- start:513 stop:1409 length:897 start_codon:yes stop_codon:yes gene_type:complete